MTPGPSLIEKYTHVRCRTKYWTGFLVVWKVSLTCLGWLPTLDHGAKKPDKPSKQTNKQTKNKPSKQTQTKQIIFKKSSIILNLAGLPGVPNIIFSFFPIVIFH